jgi:hypothetical protein
MKERLFFHNQEVGCHIDKALQKKTVADLKDQLSYDSWTKKCGEHADDYNKKFTDLNGPSNLVWCSPEDAKSLGTALYKKQAINLAEAETKKKKEIEKKKKQLTTKLKVVTEMSAEQLEAAATWQKSRSTANMKFDPQVDYVRISERGGIDNSTAESNPHDFEQKDPPGKNPRRTFSKKELARRKQRALEQPVRKPKNGKSPGGALGHNQQAGANNGKKGKGNATNNKGKGKGKGKDGAKNSDAKAKGKGKGKNAQKTGGKGASGGKSSRK